MKNLIQAILKNELNEQVHSVTEINGLGQVNKVFDVKGEHSEYIIRLNDVCC